MIYKKRKTKEGGGKAESPFSIKEEGALSYIVNSEGKKVSNGYHELKVFKQQTSGDEITAAIGRTGATSVLLLVPKNEDEFWKESEKFHDIRIDDKLGLILIEKGAMSYILDPITGKKLSKGYHEFFRKDGELYGRTGAHEEPVETELLPKETRKLEKPENKSLPWLSKLLGKDK